MKIFPISTSLQAVWLTLLLFGIWITNNHVGAILPVVLAVFFVTVIALRKRFLMIVVLLAALIIGMCRGLAVQKHYAAYSSLLNSHVELLASAENDGLYSTNSQISFSAGNLRLMDGTSLPGEILVGGFGANSVYDGDELIVAGNLRSAYGQYQGRISYAKLELIKHHPRLISQIRRKFASGLQSALPEPQASFALGLLIGQRGTLPDEVKQNLLMVGLTHIIAVSGYNLTILLNASKGLLSKRSRNMSVGLSLCLVAGFLLMTGVSASIVRAAIISVLSITAGLYGRSFRPINLILISAATTAWANPIYIWSDVSWYLSFLAFFGVLIVSPVLRQRWLPGRASSNLLVMIALETFCAELMTLPYVLYIFGQMSLVGLLANILVASLIPLAMLLSFVAALGGMLVPIMSGWISWPATIVLTYMLDVAKTLSKVPHAFVENISFGVVEMLIMYLFLLVVVQATKYKNSVKDGKITDKESSKLQGKDTYVRTFQVVDN